MDTPSPARGNGRKRFIVTDTAGLLITVAVLAASWQDRDGGKTALLGAYLSSPIRHVFADQGFAGRFVDWAGTTLKTTSRSCANPPTNAASPFTPAARWWREPWPGSPPTAGWPAITSVTLKSPKPSLAGRHQRHAPPDNPRNACPPSTPPYLHFTWT
jgi:hypothetical protein